MLRLVAQGPTNAEIGRRLLISTKTAGNHVSIILTNNGLFRDVFRVGQTNWPGLAQEANCGVASPCPIGSSASR